MTAFRNRVQMATVSAVLVTGFGMAHGQITSSRPTQNTMPGGMSADSDRSAKATAEIRERMEKARNDERQKRLIADTGKLLELATSLKSDVDKTDKYTLSLDVVRRSEEIEKLARSIRERAKQ